MIDPNMNREEAWKMLKSRLYEEEIRKRNAEKEAQESNKTDVGWGHQIHGYVLDQSRIKFANNVETGNTQKVLDGDLDILLRSLKRGL